MSGRLLLNRRAGALAATVLAAFGAVDVTLHVHSEGTLEGESGLFSRTPVAVISGADGCLGSVHLHPGSAVPGSRCPACVLANSRGVVCSAVVAVPAAESVSVAVPAVAEPAAPHPASADSRSPPALA